MSLSFSEQLLLAEAAFLVNVAHFTVRRLSLPGIPEKLAKIPFPTSPLKSVSDVAWAISSVGAKLPSAKCLALALAGQAMLTRRHIGSTVLIGISIENQFDAHAWLDCGDITLIGRQTKPYHVIHTLPTPLPNAKVA